MDECLFCKIVNNEVKSFKFYEDENCVAILDIMPRSKGMTLVIPKQHLNEINENEELSKKLFESSLKVISIIKKSLNPIEIVVSNYPSQIKHFHLRIYPFYENEIPIIENQPKKVEESELEETLSLLKSNVAQEEPKKVEEVKERSEEEVYWIKRSISID